MKTTLPHTVKDHFITGESFTLTPDPVHGFLRTEPQPQPEQLDKYYESQSYLSHDDSGNGLFGMLYRTIKKINLNHKFNLLKSVHPQAQAVLDVGCGTGDFLNRIKGNYKTTGVEINTKAAALAKAKKLNIYPSLQAVEGHYDVITLWHVFEHMPHPESTLKKLRSLLNPGGVLIIALPNFRSFDAGYYNSFWAAYDVPRHFWHFDKPSFTSLATAQNLQVIKFLPMVWDAFYVSLLSEKYKKNTLAPVRAFLIATLSNIKATWNKEYSSLIYILKEKND
ncbi:class I SAM-dependent methyltransferase [Robertkochia flava]|uniref:class I SAM-dependent methyltransferase n=1 Tax=Robertkochia flava TaxID=3447986 RepID=UPI001CCC2AAE|nr:class I SAM-dependent methyltransferase [Robertkochia marina]